MHLTRWASLLAACIHSHVLLQPLRHPRILLLEGEERQIKKNLGSHRIWTEKLTPHSSERLVVLSLPDGAADAGGEVKPLSAWID